MIVVLMGCSAPGGSVGPTATPGASELTAEASQSLAPLESAIPSVAPTEAAPSPAPTRDPDPCSHRAFDGPWTLDPLLPGSAVKVVVAELNLRAGPCTSAKRVRTLKRGDILIVSPYPDGPARGDGYPWYSVRMPLVDGLDGALPPLPIPVYENVPGSSGLWIAAGDGSNPYVLPLQPRCPTIVDVEMVRAMLPAEWLACFDAPIVLQGTYGCGGCGGAGGAIVKPGWLATSFLPNNLRTRWAPGETPISIHFKPSGPTPPPDGSIIRVTLHVDDRAAQNCTIQWPLEDPPIDVPDKVAILYCRERLVVTSYEIVGTDPDFPR